jgi:hypothetical protein
MTNISNLAAFDPKKLAVLLQNLPDGALVWGLLATGPQVAMPRSDTPVAGGFYHYEDRIEIWDGAAFEPLAILQEFDGKPWLHVPSNFRGEIK